MKQHPMLNCAATLAAFLTFGFAGPAAAQHKSQTTGERLLSEFWARVWNPPQDLSTIDRLCTEDFVLTSAGTDIVGRAAFKEWVKSFSSKVRDLRLTNLDMFSSADGTRVVSRWKVTGFNQGILGTPADDRPIEFTGIAVWEVRDGKLAHNWVERSAHELKLRLDQPLK
jgi:ketosteroid isomerase-like protein